MKHIKLFEEYLHEKKLTWKDSDAPDANGKFKELGIRALAAWLIKTRKGDVKKISGSLSQQVVFNRKKDPKYAEKMEKTRDEVYRQLGRKDLLEGSVNESAFDEVKSMYEKALVPVPDMHLYVTRMPMGGPQLLDTTKHFLEIFGKEWRMPTNEELEELLERREELGLEKPFTGDNENLWNYRYWVTISYNARGYGCHVGNHLFDTVTGESHAFYIKDFNEAEREKFLGAKHGKQYGI